MVQKYVHMYVSEKMLAVKTSRNGRTGNKGEQWRG
jgi:hypothetical protein